MMEVEVEIVVKEVEKEIQKYRSVKPLNQSGGHDNSVTNNEKSRAETV